MGEGKGEAKKGLLVPRRDEETPIIQLRGEKEFWDFLSVFTYMAYIHGVYPSLQHLQVK